MKQISLASTGFELVTKRTRKRVLLDEMILVVPWTELLSLIQPFAPSGAGTQGRRPPFPVFGPRWYTHSGSSSASLASPRFASAVRSGDKMTGGESGGKCNELHPNMHLPV